MIDIRLAYLGIANRTANIATCKRPKRIIAHTNQANCRSNSCCSRVFVFTVYALGERSAATRPIAIRRRNDECMAERRISSCNARWQALQRVHSKRGSGASIGSLTKKNSKKMKCLQIEQRKGLSQRPNCPVSCMVVSVSSFPGSIMSSFAVLYCSLPDIDRKK